MSPENIDPQHLVLFENSFWAEVEYAATRWMTARRREDTGADATAASEWKGYWIDGFSPQSVVDTRAGVEVSGQAWVGAGPRNQEEYHFIAEIPRELVGQPGLKSLEIQELKLDLGAKTLRLSVRKADVGSGPGAGVGLAS